MVARIENSLDLTEESPSYSIIPTSLVNLDIVLPHRLFRERHGWMGHRAWWIWIGHSTRPSSIQTTLTMTHGLPSTGNDYDDDDEEDMEVESQPPGGAGDASMAPPTNTQ